MLLLGNLRIWVNPLRTFPASFAKSILRFRGLTLPVSGDVLSHHYFGVDEKTVWSIAKKDAKEAHLAISQLEEYVKALDDFKRKQQEKVEDLRKKKDEIYEIARNHKALKLYLFGSCSRQNDLNFVAEFKDASLSDLGALTDDLEQFLERKIAVFPLTSLKDYSFGDRISKEMVLL